jgi:hypothetical protein
VGMGETGYFVDANYTNKFLFNFSFCKHTADDIAWGKLTLIQLQSNSLESRETHVRQERIHFFKLTHWGNLIGHV